MTLFFFFTSLFTATIPFSPDFTAVLFRAAFASRHQERLLEKISIHVRGQDLFRRAGDSLNNPDIRCQEAPVKGVGDGAADEDAHLERPHPGTSTREVVPLHAHNHPAVFATVHIDNQESRGCVKNRRNLVTPYGDRHSHNTNHPNSRVFFYTQWPSTFASLEA